MTYERRFDDIVQAVHNEHGEVKAESLEEERDVYENGYFELRDLVDDLITELNQ